MQPWLLKPNPCGPWSTSAPTPQCVQNPASHCLWTHCSNVETAALIWSSFFWKISGWVPPHVHPDDPDPPSVMLGWVHIVWYTHNSVSSHQHRRADSAATRPWRGDRGQKTRAGAHTQLRRGLALPWYCLIPLAPQSPWSPATSFCLCLPLALSPFPLPHFCPPRQPLAKMPSPKNLICHQGSTGGAGFVNRLWSARNWLNNPRKKHKMLAH